MIWFEIIGIVLAAFLTFTFLILALNIFGTVLYLKVLKYFFKKDIQELIPREVKK